MFSDNGITSLVSLGEASAWAKKSEAAKREAVRKAAGTGVGNLKALALGAAIKSLEVDVSNDVDAHSAAVGAKLGLHSSTLKTKDANHPGKGECRWHCPGRSSKLTCTNDIDISITPSASTNNEA